MLLGITLALILYCCCCLVIWIDAQRAPLLEQEGTDMKKPGRKLGCFKRPRFAAQIYTRLSDGWCEARIERFGSDTYVVRWRPVCIGGVSRIVNRWFNRGLFTIGELETFEEACLLLTEAAANEQCEGK